MVAERKSFVRRATSNFIGLMAVRGLAALVPLLVMPHLIRVLGMDGWGEISFALAVAAFVGPFVLYGFPISATAAIARAKDESSRRELLSSYLASSLFLAVLATGLIVGGLFLFASRQDVVAAPGLIMLASLAAMLTALVPSWFFVGIGDTRPMVVSQAISRLGYIVLVILFVTTAGQEQRVLGFLCLSAFAGLVAAWLTLVRVHRLKPRLAVSFSRIAKTLRDGFPAFQLAFIPLLYNAGGIFLLGVSAGARAVGQFAIAVTVTEVALTVGRLLANALLPLLATDRSRDRATRIAFMATGLVAAVLLALVAGPIASWLADDAQLVRTLIWLLAASLPFGFLQLAYNQNDLAIHGHERVASRIVIVMSLIAALMGIILIPQFAGVGAAVTILVGRVLLGTTSFIAARRIAARAQPKGAAA